MKASIPALPMTTVFEANESRHRKLAKKQIKQTMKRPNKARTIAKPKSQLTSKKHPRLLQKLRFNLNINLLRIQLRCIWECSLVIPSHLVKQTEHYRWHHMNEGPTELKSRVATIELATKVIDNEERLRLMLLHEMCHAASWLVDGVPRPIMESVLRNGLLFR
eukprot:CCRYP_006303-RA/>CCRYP_006303-RA protein AED:0.49 eAED:0.29 QI:0/0/0/1/0/0/2/0/162